MRRRPSLLPAESIEPTHTPPDTAVEDQRQILRELRALQNAIPMAQMARDDRLMALSLSGAVSRRDMAAACGLNKSRIDQIIAEHAVRLQADEDAAAAERVRRHLS